MKSLHNAPGAPPFPEVLERLFELAAVLGGAMDRGTAERGLTRARATVLWYLHREGPTTQRALSDILRVTPRNVTGLLDGLQGSGHVTRSPHPTDRRATLVSLTEQGQATVNRLRGEYQGLGARLFDGVPDGDLDAFSRVLHQVVDRLQYLASGAGTPVDDSAAPRTDT